MQAFETITFEAQGPVCTITLNRPEARNAMSHQMVAELLRAFNTLRDEAVVCRRADSGAARGGQVVLRWWRRARYGQYGVA